MADAPKNAGWKHRRGNALSWIRRPLSKMSRHLLKAAHQRAAPARLLIGALVTAVWLGFGFFAAIDYVVTALDPPEVAQRADASTTTTTTTTQGPQERQTLIQAVANGVCVFRSGKRCDYDKEEIRTDERIFIAQTAFAALAILTILFGFWTQLVGAIARAFRVMGEGHVIVAGSGESAELLARNAARHGAVVLIQREISTAELDAMASDGVAVIAGPPSDKLVLKDAGVKSADRVVAIGDKDTENVGIAAAVRTARGHIDPGDVLVRIEDLSLRDNLPEGGPLRAADIFSLAEISARLLTNSTDMLDVAVKLKHSRVHVAVVGWDTYGIAAIARILRMMWAVGLEAPRVTVFSDDPKAEQDFKDRFPRAFDQAVWKADVSFVAYNYRADDPWAPLSATAQAGGEPITAVLVSLPTDEDTLRCAARLSKRAPSADVPIYVRENAEESIKVWLTTASKTWIIPFGAPSAVLSVGALIDRANDEAAISVHEDYLRTCVFYNSDDNRKEYEQALRRRAQGADIAALELHYADRVGPKALAELREKLADKLMAQGRFTPAANRPAQTQWENLAEHYISVNRNAADHALIKLWVFDWRPVQRGRGQIPVIAPGDINDQCAAIEHRRWCADQILAGWRFDGRDDAKRQHPDLKPYADFAADEIEAAKRKDRDPWAKAPAIAALMYPNLFKQVK